MRGVHKIIILLLVLLFSFGMVAGEEWQEKDSGTEATLYDLEFLNEQTGVVVGGNYPGEPRSVILKTLDGGDEWMEQESPVDERLYGICFSSYENGWAVGANGVILSTNGATWEEEVSGKTTTLWDIFCIDDLTAVAVGGAEYSLSEGYHSNIIKTTDGGETWVSDLSGNDKAYLAVYFIGDVGYAVGGEGSVLKYTGTWNEVGPVMTTTGGLVDLRDVHCLTEDLCWVAGDSEELFYTEDGGDEWNNVNTGVDTALHAVHFSDELTGWAIGQQVIRFTDDGGESWEYQVSDIEGSATEVGLLPVSYARTLEFIDDTDGWIVGDEGLILRYGEVENPCEEAEPVICDEGYVPELYLEDDACFSSFRCIPIEEVDVDFDAEEYEEDMSDMDESFKERLDGIEINIHVTDDEKKSFGFYVKEGKVTVSELFDKPKVSVYVDSDTVGKLVKGDLNALSEGLSDGSIDIKGNTLGMKFKLLFAKAWFKTTYL
jgi:photosystem II stability/assembly factor-like uncharacterized protein